MNWDDSDKDTSGEELLAWLSELLANHSDCVCSIYVGIIRGGSRSSKSCGITLVERNSEEDQACLLTILASMYMLGSILC